MEKSITLTVNGEDYRFNVSDKPYNDFVNSYHPANKIQPSHNLLMRTVVEEDKDRLRDLLALPGAAVNIAPQLVDEYQPEFTVTVGK
jgi:hypothetical protein